MKNNTLASSILVGTNFGVGTWSLPVGCISFLLCIISFNLKDILELLKEKL